MLTVSKDTLLRVIRRRCAAPPERPTAVGIDDWAYKRGRRYGTIVCDLERRRVVTSCRIARVAPSRLVVAAFSYHHRRA